MSVYEDHVKAGLSRGRDGLLPESLAADIPEVSRLISKRMRGGEYRFTQYRELLISKGAGKQPRVISIPTARDRVALKAMAGYLLDVFPDSRPVLPQSTVESLAQELAVSRFNAYAKLDVQNFYPSVRHSEIERMLRARSRQRAPLEFILESLRTPTVPDRAPRVHAPTIHGVGVPQGLAISNLLAEIAVNDIDRVMQGRSDCWYIRFVDDVLILADSATVESVAVDCAHLFHEAGLQLHEMGSLGKSSTGLLSEGFDYLGYVFSPTGVSVRRTSVLRLESALARAFTAYKRDSASDSRMETFARQRCIWMVNLTITGCIYNHAAIGWLQYFRQMNDLTLLARLDSVVSRFAKRFGFASNGPFKSFVRAYWCVKHPSSRAVGYVPNFDSFGVEDMRRELDQMGSPAAGLADRDVKTDFFKRIRRAVNELEKDVGLFS